MIHGEMIVGAAKGSRRLGRYSLLRKIAAGGMGEVHLARLDSVQGVEKLFAIKLLLPQFVEEQSVVDMFVTEARIAARIAHTNVCQVFELGLEQDELFICMEYLRGVPATSILKTHKPLNPVSTKIAVAIVKQAAAGLQFAHDLLDENGESLGVVHRDVSPGNIFITSGGTAKVLDFGVVKAKDSSHKTKTGALKGKFGYMSPEQIMAEPLDSRSDIFSLGIVLFELLTNRRLFTRDSEYGTLKAITESPIPLLSSFRPDLPPELGAVLAKALARDLSERYSSMKVFSQALTDAMKAYGGIADAAEIGDYIQSKFVCQLGEIDSVLQEVRRSATPAPPTVARNPKTTDERTQVLQDDLTSSGFAGEGAAVSPLGVDFEESTEDVLVP
ncbi:MAG: serine/threonine protein kinase, partial [Myxococcales bacterium]|nr:serine/threonine protein kinase [Myxococcales bacterium]